MKTIPKIAISCLLLFASGFCRAYSLEKKLAFGPPDERIFGWSLMKTGGGWPNDPGAVWFNVGTSFALLNYPSANVQSRIMPISLSADYSLKPHFAFGPYAGFNQITFSDYGVGYRLRLRSVKLGGRLLFHGSDLLNDLFGFDMDIRVIDIYAGISGGIDRRTYSKEERGKDRFLLEEGSSTSGQLGLLLGVRYLFRQRVGIFAEAGKGTFGLFNFGASFKIH
jgi:hypothetical protein